MKSTISAALDRDCRRDRPQNVTEFLLVRSRRARRDPNRTEVPLGIRPVSHMEDLESNAGEGGLDSEAHGNRVSPPYYSVFVSVGEPPTTPTQHKPC